jgi:hypothetical protein
VVHELEFADVHGLLEAYARVAELGGVQSCELDLDQLRLTFSTRFPLAEPARAALQRASGLRAVRCWPAPAPPFDFVGVRGAALRERAEDQSAIDSSTSMTGMPSSTG